MTSTTARPDLVVKQRRITIEPRAVPSVLVRIGTVLGSVIAALLLGALLIAMLGDDPVATYQTMIDASLGDSLVFSQTLVRAAPLVLTAAATVVAYRTRVYTIGQDGQLVFGAVLASGVALAIGSHMPGFPTTVLVLLAGVAGGLLWALIPALSRACLGTNEVLSTLMMNFIATGLVSYLVIGSMSPWRDAENAATAQAATIPGQASLPHFFDLADTGILIAIAVALIVAAGMRYTRLGFELRVIGDSVEAARYAGIRVARRIAGVLLLSGALCGLAGAIQLVSVTQSLDPNAIDPDLGLGYTGIVIAALSRLSVIASIPVAVLMAALLNAGPALQLIDIPSALVIVLQGAILVFVAASQFFLTYQVRFHRGTALA